MTVVGTPVSGTPITGVIADIIIDLRRMVKDVDAGVPSELLWTDQDWLEFLSSGEREICERAHVLEDSSTAAVCTITLATGTADYALHNKILYVERIIPSYDVGSPIAKRTEEWLDVNYIGWRDLDDGLPEYAIERQTNYLTLVPAPSSTYNGETLALTVKRRPLVDFSVDDTTPEIGAHLYDDLKYWCLFKAFSKRDAEIYDEQKSTYWAKFYYALFESRVGPRPDVNTQRIMKQEPTSGLRIAPYRRG
jgi:hypothetical protein